MLPWKRSCTPLLPISEILDGHHKSNVHTADHRKETERKRDGSQDDTTIHTLHTAQVMEREGGGGGQKDKPDIAEYTDSPQPQPGHDEEQCCYGDSEPPVHEPLTRKFKCCSDCVCACSMGGGRLFAHRCAHWQLLKKWFPACYNSASKHQRVQFFSCLAVQIAWQPGGSACNLI